MPPGALSVENCGGVVWRGAVFSFFVRSAPTAVGPYIAVQLGVK